MLSYLLGLDLKGMDLKKLVVSWRINYLDNTCLGDIRYPDSSCNYITLTIIFILTLPFVCHPNHLLSKCLYTKKFVPDADNPNGQFSHEKFKPN